MNELGKLHTFLYLLLRDKMTFGEVEKIMEDVEKLEANGNTPVFSEKTQSLYAWDLAKRLS